MARLHNFGGRSITVEQGIVSELHEVSIPKGELETFIIKLTERSKDNISIWHIRFDGDTFYLRFKEKWGAGVIRKLIATKLITHHVINGTMTPIKNR